MRLMRTLSADRHHGTPLGNEPRYNRTRHSAQIVLLGARRPALEAPDYVTAADLSRRLAGEGISRQAFALQPKVIQVDRWVRETPHRVVEVHPEASFAELAGTPLALRKSSWAGMVLRRRLLAGARISLPDELGLAGEKAGVDDVLDAAAAAWTAVRVRRGQASCTPPEIFSDGLASAIWT
jgi:predicted RNase H-like nuclease